MDRRTLLLTPWRSTSPLRVRAQVPLLAAKSVPRVQAIPLPHDEAAFLRDGIELTRYHADPTLRRPFLYPINGPSGRSLTRMGHRATRSGTRITTRSGSRTTTSTARASGATAGADRLARRLPARGRRHVRLAHRPQRLGRQGASPDPPRAPRRVRAALDGEDWLLVVDVQLDAAARSRETARKFCRVVPV